MSENIYTVSSEAGKTDRITFAELANGEDQLSSNSLKEYHEAHPDSMNLIVEFPDGVFDDLDGMEVCLDREDKTLGTYVTRANKIVQGIDPSSRSHRSGSASSSGKKAPVGIEEIDSETVRLFMLEDESQYAEVSVSGEVHTTAYGELSYFIDSILSPVQRANRIAQLRQFSDGVEASPPQFALKFEGMTVELGDSKPSDEKVLKAKGEIAGELIVAGKTFDPLALQSIAPVETGGGEEWLNQWLLEAYPDKFEEVDADEPEEEPEPVEA